MQTARAVKIEFEPKAAFECGAISWQGRLEDGARGIVALHHAGVHVHPVDNVAFAEGDDGVALFQAGEREWRVADLPDEPVPDIRGPPSPSSAILIANRSMVGPICRASARKSSRDSRALCITADMMESLSAR